MKVSSFQKYFWTLFGQIKIYCLRPGLRLKYQYNLLRIKNVGHKRRCNLTPWYLD